MEEWKKIEGFDNYEVSSLGRVRSIVSRYADRKYLVGDTDPRGYCRIRLSTGKYTYKRVLLHRLVAQAFIPNPDNKPCVNHLDNDPTNNVVSNLEWCTYSENLKWAQDQGRLYEAQRKGGIVTTDKLKEKAVANAKALVGQKINKWTVLEYIGYKPIGKKGLQRPYVKCQCECGTISELEAIRLILNQANGCKYCAHKKKI